MHITHNNLQLAGLRWITTLLLFFSFILSGCVAQQTMPPSPRPGSEGPAIQSPTLGSASTLYSQAKMSLTQGRYQQAELLLERALRIEPRNGDYWYMMAKVKYQQNLHEQAIQFCLKSKSLAGRNSELIRLNDELIAEARQAEPK